LLLTLDIISLLFFLEIMSGISNVKKFDGINFELKHF